MSTINRKLVTVRRIDAINPIEGADAIEVATIGGWQVVVKKGEFQVNDPCVYFEIDSFLPDGNPAWQFLVDKQGRTFEGRHGHRLRTVKLRGQISQGFVVPLSKLDAVRDDVLQNGYEGRDFSELLGVVKWEQPLPAELAGQAEGLFPSFIRRTDQERCQNLVNEIFQYDTTMVPFDISGATPEGLATMQEKGLLEFHYGTWMKINKAKASRDDRYEVSLKMDGSSCTVFARVISAGDDSLPQIESGVCSRNLQLKVNAENADNTFISVAIKSGLLDALEEMTRGGAGSFAVQGELMGPGIQGNREGLKAHKLFIFDVQNLDTQAYLTPAERKQFMRDLHDRGVRQDLVEHVPICAIGITLHELGITNVKELLGFAEGPSLVHPVREGLVFKRMDGQFSFKAISNAFLTKEKD